MQTQAVSDRNLNVREYRFDLTAEQSLRLAGGCGRAASNLPVVFRDCYELTERLSRAGYHLSGKRVLEVYTCQR